MTAPLIDRLRAERDEALGLVAEFPDVEMQALLHRIADLYEEAAAELARLESQLAGLAKPAPFMGER